MDSSLNLMDLKENARLAQGTARQAGSLAADASSYSAQAALQVIMRQKMPCQYL